MKKKNGLIFVLLMAVLIFTFTSCVCVRGRANGGVPYFAAGELVFRQERLVLLYDFLNESGRSVEKVDFVVCTEDSGESAEYNSGENFWEDSVEEYSSAYKFCVQCKISVPPGESVQDYFVISDFFSQTEYEEELPEIESFYAEKIYYSDGTVFEDVFGRYAR